ESFRLAHGYSLPAIRQLLYVGLVKCCRVGRAYSRRPTSADNNIPSCRWVFASTLDPPYKTYSLLDRSSGAAQRLGGPGVPGRLAAAPQIVQQMVITAAIHAMPESVVDVRRQFAVVSQPGQRVAFKEQVVAVGQSFDETA